MPAPHHQLNEHRAPLDHSARTVKATCPALQGETWTGVETPDHQVRPRVHQHQESWRGHLRIAWNWESNPLRWLTDALVIGLILRRPRPFLDIVPQLPPTGPHRDQLLSSDWLVPRRSGQRRRAPRSTQFVAVVSRRRATDRAATLGQSPDNSPPTHPTQK